MRMSEASLVRCGIQQRIWHTVVYVFRSTCAPSCGNRSEGQYATAFTPGQDPSTYNHLKGNHVLGDEAKAAAQVAGHAPCSEHTPAHTAVTLRCEPTPTCETVATLIERTTEVPT
jgi:hypothetical protein